MPKPENPHAFPLSDETFTNPGMRLRDWFAGQALAGTIAGGCDIPTMQEDQYTVAATDAYRYADALLLAREGHQS